MATASIGAEDEETVMTPLRTQDGTLIRIERVKHEDLKTNRVHYVGDGPYTGIAVNRAIKGKPKKVSPDNLRRFTAHVHNKDSSSKELRELRFWYKLEARDQNEETTEAFFHDLLNPVNFPRDYLSFVKRILSLVKCYPAIQLLELEIRPFRDTDLPVDVRGRPLSVTTDATMIRRTVSLIAQPSAPARRQQSMPALGHSNRDSTAGSVSTTPGEILPVPTRLGTSKKERKPDENDNILSPSDVEPAVNGSPEAAAVAAVKKMNRKSKLVPTDNNSIALIGDVEEKMEVQNSVSTGLANIHYARQLEAETKTESFHQESVHHSSVQQNIIKHNSASTTVYAVNGTEITEDITAIAASKRKKNRKSKAAPEDGAVDRPDEEHEEVFIRQVTTGLENLAYGRELNNQQEVSPVSPVVVTSVPPPGSDPSGEARRSSRRTSSGRRSKSDAESGPHSKQQKLLSTLEDAFPTVLSVDNIAGITRLQRQEAESILVELLQAGLVTEVDRGLWIRTQKQPGPKQTTSKSKRGSQVPQQLNKHEFRLVAHMPVLLPKEQPTVAIITSLYCEKLAVDAMMDTKTTYIRCKKEGEGQVYTVGLIGKQRVVSTKLSILGGGTAETVAAGNTITRLLGTFGKIDHVMFVGVAGGVANLEDDEEHVRLGDVVISTASSTGRPLYFHVADVQRDSTTGAVRSFQTKTWEVPDQEFQNIATKFQHKPKAFTKKFDLYIKQGLTELDESEVSFQRPPPDSDRLYLVSEKKDTILDHPAVTPGSARDSRPAEPIIHYSAIASGRVLRKDADARHEFCHSNSTKAVDSGLQVVLDSVQGNRKDSYVVVRGISDYTDGMRHRDWQPYAALTAAAAMKSLVLELNLPNDEDDED